MPKQKLILTHRYALGDTVCMTALTRDIARAYPGQYELIVNTHFTNMWNHNPHVRLYNAKTDSGASFKKVKLSYREGIRRAGSGEMIHMLRSYHEDFRKQTGISVPLTEPKGEIFLTADEDRRIIEGKYWLLNAGGKMDCTVKVWRPKMWQRVVDMLREHGIWCVQSGVNYSKHFHPKLYNVVDAIDHHDDARMLCNMIKYASGVLCPITAMMHIAAIYDTPCVVVAGGREEPWWESYSNQYPGAFGSACTSVKVAHTYLHTIGSLSCCQTKGCWKHRTVPVGLKDGYEEPSKLCHLPVMVDGAPGPKCLDLITPEQVVDAVLAYGTHLATPVAPRIAVIPGLGQVVPIEPELDVSDTVPRIVIPGNRKIEEPEPVQTTPAKVPTGLDSSVIGGKFTAFVLCYGDYPTLAKTCLTSLINSVPPNVLDLRVICHAVCDETRRFVSTLPATKVYDHVKNRGKYVSMREAFHDPKCPITTNYVLWFDDDTKIVRQDWLDQLSKLITSNHAKGNRMFGWKFSHDISMYAKNGNAPSKWFKTAKWWRGRNLRVRGRQQEAPNGTVLEFAVGWHWAIATEAIRLGDIPDRRLNHNGGDITIGEQIHQAGFKIANWNQNKQFVWCPTKENGGRRGVSEKFPWSGAVA